MRQLIVTQIGVKFVAVSAGTVLYIRSSTLEVIMRQLPGWQTIAAGAPAALECSPMSIWQL